MRDFILDVIVPAIAATFIVTLVGSGFIAYMLIRLTPKTEDTH